MFGIDPDTVDLYHRLAAPSLLHPLGTDELGRDLLLRLIEGGRVSLLVGIVAALVAAVFGTAMGLIAGYRGGRLDAALMRFTDGVIALPLLPLLIVLAALDLKKLGVPSAIMQSPAISIERIIVLVASSDGRRRRGSCAARRSALKSRDFVRAAARWARAARA